MHHSDGPCRFGDAAGVSFRGFLIGAVTLSGLLACAAGVTQEDQAAVEGRKPLADLFVVDCLLPGQVRQLGRRTYVGPRRPTRATASDCRIRGGEYVAYDRADYKSALNVWLPQAKAGDPVAQTNVGEILERGVGTEPNYELAAEWYRRAAEQGYDRAQFNLGTLYELGRGVERDRLVALNWYRAAWGMAEDDLIFASIKDKEQADLRAEYEQSLQALKTQIDILRQQIQQKEEALRSKGADANIARGEIAALEDLIARLEGERSDSQTKLDGFASTREPTAGTNEPPLQSLDARPVQVGDIDFGRYFALIIGVQNYQLLDDLQTPLADVDDVRALLEDKYGFTARVLRDADHETIMRAVVETNEQMGENDNLLIYYAGHGNLSQYGQTQTGHWLPSNAEHAPRNTYWIDNSFITQHLSISRAKRILVVADSCYAGLLSTDPAMVLAGPEQGLPAGFVKKIADKPARMVLSSGGESPVLDGGGGRHSVFARAFIDALTNNEGILAVPTLYSRIASEVRVSAAGNNFVQEPQLRTIKSAGHALGQFFFVPN